MKLLITDDDRDILSLYRTFLESKDKEVTLTTDDRKCVEEYKRKHDPQELENYFDFVILDQKMPIVAGLQADEEILKINPKQRIVFSSEYLRKHYLKY